MFTFYNKDDLDEFLGKRKDGVVAILLCDGLQREILYAVTNAVDGFDPAVEERWHLLVPNKGEKALSRACDVEQFKFDYTLNQELIDFYGDLGLDLPQISFLDADNSSVVASIHLKSPPEAVAILREIIKVIARHVAEQDFFDKTGALREIVSYSNGRRAEAAGVTGKVVFNLLNKLIGQQVS